MSSEQVTANITARSPATNGQQQTGPVYFQTESPVTFTLGKQLSCLGFDAAAGHFQFTHWACAWFSGMRSVPKLVEDGLSSMARGEQAVIIGTATDATPEQPNALLPSPPADIKRVELVLKLLQFTQVATVLLQ